MRNGMRKLRGLKVTRFLECSIDLKEYFDLFSGATMSDKIGVTELNFFCSIVYLIAVLSKCMCRALTVNLYCLKNQLTCLSKWILLNIFMKF